MIPLFRAIRSSLVDVQKLQDALSKVFNSLLQKQIIDGLLTTSIELTAATAKEINHGLGKPIRGWIIVDKNAAADIYASVSSTPNVTFILTSNADVTIKLWVF